MSATPEQRAYVEGEARACDSMNMKESAAALRAVLADSERVAALEAALRAVALKGCALDTGDGETCLTLGFLPADRCSACIASAALAAGKE